MPTRSGFRLRAPSRSNATWILAWFALLLLLFRILDHFGLSLPHPLFTVVILAFAGLAVPVAVWTYLQHRNPLQTLWLRPFSPTHIPLVILMTLLLPVLALMLSLPFGNMLFLDAPYRLWGLYTPVSDGGVLGVLLLILVYILLPTICEELLFRCVLPHSFAEFGPVVTALLSAFLFSFFDFNLGTFLVTFAVGISLYLVLYVTRSMTPVLIVRLFYQTFTVFFRQELASFYRSAGSGTVFFFLLTLIFGIIVILICSVMIHLNLDHAKKLKENSEAYAAREKHPLPERIKATVTLLGRAVSDPFIWGSALVFALSLFIR